MSATIPDMSDEISYDRVLELFRRADYPVLTSTDVAQAFDISQQAAYKRLRKLHERGEIKRREAGANAVVWWIPERDYDC